MVFDCGQISKTRDLPNTISTKILSSPDRGAILSNYLKYVKCKIRKTSELSNETKVSRIVRETSIRPSADSVELI